MNVNGFLEYVHDIYGAARPDSKSGHIRIAPAHSGSPLWTTDVVHGKERSAAMLYQIRTVLFHIISFFLNSISSCN